MKLSSNKTICANILKEYRPEYKNKVRNKIETQPLQTALELRMTGARLVADAGR